MATAAIAKTAARAGTRGGAQLRLCAVAALVSVAAHLWMGWEHRAMPWEAALMLLMAAACLPCAVAVWRGAHVRALPVLLTMALVMVAVHAALLVGQVPLGGHQHGAMNSMVAMGAHASQADPRAVAMLGIIALELGVGMLAAWAMRRARGCPTV